MQNACAKPPAQNTDKMATGKRIRTVHHCVKCKVTLHAEGCFKEYHSSESEFSRTFALGGLGNANKGRKIDNSD